MCPRSRVEESGNWAHFYDLMMDLLFLGRYPHFMAQVMSFVGVETGDAILDLGSGTGRNARLMGEKTGPTGRVVGVDISDRMLRRARRQCAGHPQIDFARHRIERPLPFEEEFDTVFLSFVLHGLEDVDKRYVLANAHRALKSGGSLCILDYDEFSLERTFWPFRWLFAHLECELASEFLKLDLARMLAEMGFTDPVSHELIHGYVRLLETRKRNG
jgi:ubiquinone/menaquinone biosynthesis C-methylase UbiE